MAASKISEHGKGLSAVGASKGGLARAEALTKEERSAIAKKAAADRWAAVRGLPVETHSGVLKLGRGIPCSVLDNGKRVFSVNGLTRAFGLGGKGRHAVDGAMLPPILAGANVRAFVSEELLAKFES